MPVADADSITVDEGGTATAARSDSGTSVLDNDTDVDLPNDTLTVPRWSAGPSSRRRLTLNADGTFSYTHDGSENFTDSFTYTVSDDDGQTTDRHGHDHDHAGQRQHAGGRWPTASRSPKAARPRRAGFGGDQRAGQRHGRRPAGRHADRRAGHRSSSLSHGSLTLNADGTFSYTHDGSENFTDSFTYRVSDGDGNDGTRPRSRSRSPRSTTTRRWPTAERITVAEGGTATVLDGRRRQRAGQRHDATCRTTR